MLTFAVCLYRKDIFKAVCLPALEQQQADHGVEVITTTDSRSIYYAYERLRRKASFGTVVYLHDDLQLMDKDTAPRVMRLMDSSGAGLMGVVGSKAGYRSIPWWETEGVGLWCHVKPSNDGVRFFDPERRIIRRVWTGQRAKKPFQPAECLDGIFMADRMDLPWPRRLGWHGYDAERSEQTREAGGEVYVGDVLVCHYNQPHDPDWGRSIAPIYQALRTEWGLE